MSRVIEKRRESAKQRLLLQLEKGTKTEKGSILTKATVGLQQIPLEEKDIKRIKKELNMIESQSELIN